MLMTNKFLHYFEAIENGDEIDMSDLDVRTMYEEEIRAVIEELAVEHPDTVKYSEAVKNLKTLAEAYNNYERGQAERIKADTQLEEVARRRYVNWDIVLPKLGGIAASVGLTMVWFAIEREHPLPMRIVQEINALTVPRGL